MKPTTTAMDAEEGPPPADPARPAAAFDPAALEASSGKGWITECLLAYPQRWMALARFFFRVLHLPFTKWYVVLRYDDVREVLSRHKEFPVAWGGRMRALTSGRNFVLGMPYDETYKRSYQELARAFPLEDVGEHVERPAAAMAGEIVAQVAAMARPRFDAVEKLINTVPARLCATYYGVEVKDPVLFAKWTLAISSHVFGPDEDEARERQARAAAKHLSGAIYSSIAAARTGGAAGIAMRRLIEVCGTDDDAIHAHLFGMVLGFVPTDVLAGGNILETLLRRPEFLERARAAALAGDDELLWRCLREALRFRHINPGPWRESAGYYTLGAGQRGSRTIPAGARVIALTQSAMFDARRVPRPKVFDPYRKDEDYLVFGVGQHWCVGAYIAKAQITQTFKPLLVRNGLRAVGPGKPSVKRFNDLFPLHLEVAFDP